MARPGQDPVSKDEIPWWLKFAGRGLGTVGGISKYMITNTVKFSNVLMNNKVVIIALKELLSLTSHQKYTS